MGQYNAASAARTLSFCPRQLASPAAGLPSDCVPVTLQLGALFPELLAIPFCPGYSRLVICIQIRIQSEEKMSLFVRKDLGTLLAEAGSGTLRRELGPLALVTLGIGAVIGAGIFVLSGTVASQNAGPALTLSMVFAGIAASSPGFATRSLRA
jgi:hypothetical protein